MFSPLQISFRQVDNRFLHIRAKVLPGGYLELEGSRIRMYDRIAYVIQERPARSMGLKRLIFFYRTADHLDGLSEKFSFPLRGIPDITIPRVLLAETELTPGAPFIGDRKVPDMKMVIGLQWKGTKEFVVGNDMQDIHGFDLLISRACTLCHQGEDEPTGVEQENGNIKI
jgi:hypothetical protein